MMDHRLALALLTVLLILAAGPLAWGWAHLLPEERSPFEVDGNRTKEGALQPSRDLFAVCLLALITFSYVLKIPGVPVGAAVRLFAGSVPQDYFQWMVIGGRAFCVVTPGLAAAYGALRKGPLQLSLILGGVLVVALWLASPYLRAAIQS